jgi:hypothetical protein
VETAVIADGAPDSRFDGAEPKHVDLASAVMELRRAWTAVDDEARRRYGEGMLRLREVNLVIYAATEANAGLARATAARFVNEHSGRVIILVPPGPVIAAPGQGSGGSPALIHTSCVVDERSDRPVCSELVIIGAAGEEGRAGRAAVIGLLVPDLPVMGWWSGRFSPLDPALFWLAGLSDRLVLDSEWVEDVGTGGGLGAGPGLGVHALADIVRRDPETRVHDLAWHRIGPWCALTAELFDSAERRRLIPHISRLRVEHCGAPAQALLYSAWFGSRLGLNLVGDRWQEGAARCIALLRGGGAGGERRTPASMVIEMRSLRARGGDARGLVGVSVYVESSPADAQSAASTGESIGIAAAQPPAVSMRLGPHSRVCAACVADGPQEITVKTVEMTPYEDWRLLSRIFEAPGSDALFARVAGLASALGDDPRVPVVPSGQPFLGRE